MRHEPPKWDARVNATCAKTFRNSPLIFLCGNLSSNLGVFTFYCSWHTSSSKIKSSYLIFVYFLKDRFRRNKGSKINLFTSVSFGTYIVYVLEKKFDS